MIGSQIQSWLAKLHHRKKVVMRWVASHVKMEGNEETDKSERGGHKW